MMSTLDYASRTNASSVVGRTVDSHDLEDAHGSVIGSDYGGPGMSSINDSVPARYGPGEPSTQIPSDNGIPPGLPDQQSDAEKVSSHATELAQTGDVDGLTNIQSHQRQVQKLKKLLLLVIIIVIILIIAIAVPLGVLYGKKSHHSSTSGASQASNTSTSINISLSTTTYDYSNVPPLTDSKIGAGVLQISDMFTPSSAGASTMVAYNSDKGKLCNRIKSANTWHTKVQCVEGANPLPNSPLTVLDWLGGVRIFFGGFVFFMANVILAVYILCFDQPHLVRYRSHSCE